MDVLMRVLRASNHPSTLAMGTAHHLQELSTVFYATVALTIHLCCTVEGLDLPATADQKKPGQVILEGKKITEH